MRRSSRTPVERAILLALSACGVDHADAIDGSLDATVEADVVDAFDGADGAGDEGDAGLTTFDAWPLPDGCVVTGQPTNDASCGYTVLLNDPGPCLIDVDAGTQDPNVCVVLCDPYEAECVYTDLNVGDGGHAFFVGCGGGDGCVGRLHERARAHVAARCTRARPNRGAWLGRAAALEASAIEAFDIFAGDLAQLGAPARLVRDARRAARDERRHARATAGLAARFGGRVERLPRAHQRPRDVHDIAIENAIEGCVRETFGAAIAAWQAARATDPIVRRAMRSIARDEARHADLGWRVDAWLGCRVEASAARARAVEALRVTTVAFGSGDDVLGLPDAATAARLVDALFEDDARLATNAAQT